MQCKLTMYNKQNEIIIIYKRKGSFIFMLSCRFVGWLNNDGILFLFVCLVLVLYKIIIIIINNHNKLIRRVKWNPSITFTFCALPAHFHVSDNFEDCWKWEKLSNKNMKIVFIKIRRLVKKDTNK